MTRLDGTQVLVGGQLMWLSLEFSVDGATSPGLGSGDGGRLWGSNGYVPGGGAFLAHRVSPDLALGFAVASNFGSIIDYDDDDWVGRYRVQDVDLVGVSIIPSIAYRVNDKLSLGAGINGMYGMYDQKVAINNAVPSPGTRLGLTYSSQIDLDFSGKPQFSGVGPILSALLQSRGLLDARVDVGAKVPQQVMGSVYTEIDDRWALLGNVGWQDWSEFGEIEIGIDNTQNPVSLTNPLSFDDTWHVAVGAQYRTSKQWKVNFGLAYDSGFQDDNDIPALLAINSGWRLGAGGERQASELFKWGFTTALIYGGNMDVDKRSTLPPLLGGRGDLVGSYDQTLAVVLTVYGNWAL